MDNRNNNYLPIAASALSGFLVCLAISMATGRKEAWDAGVYFSLGIPAMCAVMFAIGYRFPKRTWRWTWVWR
jgi:O-antigen/teichoic acid export membrane protein